MSIVFPMRKRKEIEKAENEMCDRVWLNRHCETIPETNDIAVYEAAVKKGQPMSYRHQGSPETEFEIRRQAYDAAQRLIEKYGTDAIGNEIEVAFLEGKLSALRWVLGEDWDFLDT